jgi:predicted nucleic acid-binding protein
MIVVTDTSPLCYLVLIGCEEFLPKLYHSVATTQTVIAELRHADAPPVVRAWAEQPPVWLVIHPDPVANDPELTSLHAGERTVLALTKQLHADIVILDELAARTIARKRGYKVVGLLGLLADAADAGLINLNDAIFRLRQTNFRASPALLRNLLSRGK